MSRKCLILDELTRDDNPGRSISVSGMMRKMKTHDVKKGGIPSVVGRELTLASLLSVLKNTRMQKSETWKEICMGQC